MELAPTRGSWWSGCLGLEEVYHVHLPRRVESTITHLDDGQNGV